MFLRPFYRYETGCAAYVLGCATCAKCAVVDPQEEDVRGYADFARSKGMKITHVIDTHVHADHRSGGRALAELTGAKYCLHGSAEVGQPGLAREQPERRNGLGALPAVLRDRGDGLPHAPRRDRRRRAPGLWRDLGYAVGALLAGVTADALGVPAAIWLVAALTFASGAVVAVRMRDATAHRYLA